MRKAEICCALNIVYHHHSVRSASKESQLFPTMSPDSAIAKEFGMSHTKLGYLINYGIAPYFHVKIMDEILPKLIKLLNKVLKADGYSHHPF